MSALLLPDTLSPAELVEAGSSRTLTHFLALYGESPLLLVRVESADSELLSGLRATAVRAGAGQSVAPVADLMQFHTVIQPLPLRTPTTVPGAHRDEPRVLLQILEGARHFVVPLRKREEADMAYQERISVGRARNKDIVLRHGSVSKFHAWFDMDEASSFRVSDAGSKNLTRVNGEKLTPREPRAVGPGDAIRFGAVECLLCSPNTLWAALHAAHDA